MINVPNENPFSKVDEIGIAIRRFPAEDQIHIGLLYKIDDADPLIVHLRGPVDFRNERPSENFRWLQIDLHETNRRVIASYCKLLASKNSMLPYGLAYQEPYFSSEGDFIGAGRGMTCATFVMAVFAALHFPILKLGEWKPAEGDNKDWQIRYVSRIRNGNPFVADILEKQIGSPRYLPEEVAAGAVSKDRPLGAVEASKRGRRIRQQLRASY